MERRKFMITAAGALATIGVAGKAFADEGEPTPQPVNKLEVTNRIGRNHGHDFDLTLEDLVLLLREASANGDVAIDIQGSSGHPHTLTLSADEITEILVAGTLVKNSSVDAGHPHPVEINVTEVAPMEPAQ